MEILSQTTALVLAGGMGVRMHSPTSKMLMRILGRPLVMFPVQCALQATAGRVIVVSGDALEEIEQVLTLEAPAASGRLAFAAQAQPLGTADAVKAGMGKVEDSRHLLVLNGDVPGVTSALVERMAKRYASSNARVVFVAFRPPDPTGYGRVLCDDSGTVCAIKEQKELEGQEHSIDLVNAGIYLADTRLLKEFLALVVPSANQKEYLLTDLISYAVGKGLHADIVVATTLSEVAGVNNRAELADATQSIRRRRNRALMVSGVSMPQPETVDVDFGVTVGPDTTLEAGVALRGKTRVGPHCHIGRGSVIVDSTIAEHTLVKPYCMLESSDIRQGCTVGPFAHTRPGTVLEPGAKVGNFVETKKTVLGAGSKANHLSYLGDAVIGKKVNVGAGTITCNYDGYNKFKTVLEDGVFIGSDTQLVAPVTVGANAVVAAGTTVTRDVPPGALAISRVEQVHREGYAEKKKAQEERGE